MAVHVLALNRTKALRTLQLLIDHFLGRAKESDVSVVTLVAGINPYPDMDWNDLRS